MIFCVAICILFASQCKELSYPKEWKEFVYKSDDDYYADYLKSFEIAENIFTLKGTLGKNVKNLVSVFELLDSYKIKEDTLASYSTQHKYLNFSWHPKVTKSLIDEVAAKKKKKAHL